MANLDRHVWEGWTPRLFIEDLEWQLEMVQTNRSHNKPLQTKAELKEWCKYNQPHYKKHIPEVVNYFATKHNLK